MQQPGIFYHVPGPQRSPEMSLRSWNSLYAAGEVTDADWDHPAVPVGWDGGVASLHTTLQVARHYREDDPRIPIDRPILRIRIPDEFLHKVGDTPGGEEVPCYPDEIPPEWIEIVDEDDPDEPDPRTYIPWLMGSL
jgi:hypothetical protein